MTDDKVKFLMRIAPDTDRKIKTAMPRANCRSQNEFVENALQFYCDYLASEDVAEFLPPIILHALRGTIQCSEERISRLLFKLAVEMDMMMNVLAVQMDVPDEDLKKLRAQCVRDVKATNGSITYKDAQDRQSRGRV